MEEIEHIPRDDIVCLVDAFDVMVTGSAQEIVQKFLEFDSDIVFSTELNCFPARFCVGVAGYGEDARQRLRQGDSMSIYLNSGGMIGYQHALRDMLRAKPMSEIEEMCEDGGDQAYVTHHYLSQRHTGRLSLDSHSRLFQTMVQVAWGDMEVRGHRVHNNVMKQYPCFVHFAGQSHISRDRQNLIPLLLDQMEAHGSTQRGYVFNSFGLVQYFPSTPQQQLPLYANILRRLFYFF